VGDKQAHAAWFGERQRLAVIAISIIGAAGRGNATTEAERTSLTFSSTKAPCKDQCLMGVAFIRGPNRAGATHPDNGFTLHSAASPRTIAFPAPGWRRAAEHTCLERRRRSVSRAAEVFAIAPALGDPQIA
jgi:hypothetical protein